MVSSFTAKAILLGVIFRVFSFVFGIADARNTAFGAIGIAIRQDELSSGIPHGCGARGNESNGRHRSEPRAEASDESTMSLHERGRETCRSSQGDVGVSTEPQGSGAGERGDSGGPARSASTVSTNLAADGSKALGHTVRLMPPA
jgi:hypothetical protein